MFRQAIYTRVSSGKQADNFSTEYQRETCEKYGQLQGRETYGHYHDTQTGTDYLERKAVQHVLNLLETGVITHVTFMSIDRVGRDADIIKRFIRDVYRLGGKVSIASTLVTYDTADKAIKDNFWQIAVADYELQTIRERTLSVRMQAFLKGSYAKRPPYGYRTKSTGVKGAERFVSLEIVDSDAESIRTILETFARTRSKAATLKTANELQLSHLGSSKSHWHYSTITKVIADVDMYAGIPQTIRFNPAKETSRDNPEITYTYPQIVSLDLAERVRIADSLNDLAGDTNRDSKPKPFLKLVYCDCGRQAAYEQHSTLSLSKYVCPTGQQAKAARKLKAKQYHDNPCSHSISPVIFERVLRTYIDGLDSGEYVSELELELSQKYGRIRYKRMQLQILQINRENAIKRRKEIAEKVLLIDPTNTDILSVLTETARDTQQEIDRYATQETALLSEIEPLERILHALELPMNIDTEYSEIETDTEVITEVTYTFIHAISNRMNKVRGAVSELASSLDNENWERVSYLMAFLGLRFKADFSEPNQSLRRASVRVVIDWESTSSTRNSGTENGPKGGNTRTTTVSENSPLLTMLLNLPNITV